MSAWRDSLTEDRYATRGSPRLRRRRAKISRGPLADEFSLPEGVLFVAGVFPRLQGDISALLALADELDKLGRSPSGSTAAIGDQIVEVSNDLDSSVVAGITRLPWYSWSKVADECRMFATGPAREAKIDFSSWNFEGLHGEPLVHHPVAAQCIEFVRVGPSMPELAPNADEVQRGAGHPGPGAVVTETDYVVELEVPWCPRPGAPAPHLWADRERPSETVLAFRAGALTEASERFAVVRFPGCQFLTLAGGAQEERHRPELRGLGRYGVYEVLNSSLYDRRVSAGGPQAGGPQQSLRSGAPGCARHFVITFGDDTFECLADDIVGELTSDLARTLGPTFRAAGLAAAPDLRRGTSA